MTSPTRPARLRYLPVLIFLIGVAPYLGLKLIWLTGHPVGILDPALMHSPYLWGANLLTLAMDAFAAVLVVAMSLGRRRIPAWLLVVPMWVATGLLLPILIAEPLALLVTALFPSPATHEASAMPLASWVFTLVYVGFSVQAVALISAFGIHARDRWPGVLAGLGRRSDSPLEQVLRPVLRLGASLAAVAAVLHVLAGIAHRGSWGLADYVNAGIAAAAVVAAIWLARGRDEHPSPAMLLLAWAAPAALFAWGLWLLLGSVSGGAGGPLTNSATHALVTGTALVKLLAGLVIGMATLALATVRQRPEGAATSDRTATLAAATGSDPAPIPA